MRTNRNNKTQIVEFNKLYMSFAIEKGYQDDIMEAVWNYANEVCGKGTEFIKKNLITCKPANSATIYWDYEPAEPGDWFCKFCCGQKNSTLSVNAFINSRKQEDSDMEVFYVRIALCINDQKAAADWFKARTGVLSSYTQAQEFDELWESLAGIEDSLYMKQSA